MPPVRPRTIPFFVHTYHQLREDGWQLWGERVTGPDGREWYHAKGARRGRRIHGIARNADEAYWFALAQAWWLNVLDVPVIGQG
jgi:hypothetical protein